MRSEATKKAQKEYRARNAKKQMVVDEETKTGFDWFRDCKQLTNDQALNLLLTEYYLTHGICKNCGCEGRMGTKIDPINFECIHSCGTGS